MRRTWIHAAAVPKELLAAKSRASQALQADLDPRQAGERLEAASSPASPSCWRITREIAAAKAQALGTTPYGALIDEYDPGVGEAHDRPDLRRTGRLPAAA